MASTKITTPEQKRIRDLLDQIADLPEIGSIKALGEALNPRCTPQAIYKWSYTGFIPVKRAVEIERLTGGKFTRQQLAPWAYV